MPDHRTLVIQTGFLGDLVLTLPLLRVLRRTEPRAELTLMVRSGLGELVRDQPGIVATIEVPKPRGWLQRLAPDLQRLRQLRRAGFHKVYLAHRSFRTGLYARGTGAPLRIGFAGTAAGWACTRAIDYSRTQHVAARQLMLAGLSPAETERELSSPAYVVPADSRRRAEALLGELGIAPGEAYVSLAPGSVWPTKRWTPEGFAAVAQHAASTRRPVVLVGASGEHELCERVRVAAGSGVVNLAGRTTPSELAAVLAGSRLCVGNDSGPGHLARAVGTPVVAVFGPTDSRLGFRPLGLDVLTVDVGQDLDCRPCSVHGSLACPRGHHRCMLELTPETVLARIESWPLNPLRSSPGKPESPRE